MRWIELTDGKTTAVSDERYAYLSQFAWRFSPTPMAKSDGGYAVRTLPNGKTLAMHIEIASLMGLDLTKDIDHKDRHSLNNSDSNLRAATRSQNIRNQAPNCRNKSGYKGVSFDKSRGLWRAQIRNGDSMETIGRYSHAIDAARAYDDMAFLIEPDCAYLNFPEEYK